MRQGIKLNLVVGLVFLAFAVSPTVALATPHLTLTPTSSSIVNGTNFDVTIGVASGTETASGVDVVGTFDVNKLEIVSITKPATGTAFTMDNLQSLSDNTLGKFSFSAYDTNSTTVEDRSLAGSLAVITFKAKNTGTASVNFTCQTGSTIDSNIMKSTSVDIIDCSTNQSGSYTITASSETNTTPTTTTATPTISASTTQAELPKAGSVGSTVGLMVFGIVSVFSALFLRLL
ncbi:MAG: cohesin domain-containing protein [Candidatus Shapirobacteria bacterium]|nr:cohesin domain-containing protein [Candidatus Shapirobacteria bacterium]